MTSPIFTNKDAEFLDQLSRLTTFGPEDFEKLARLRAIAERLQRLDDKSIGAYSLGFKEGRESVLYAHSNLADSKGTFRNLDEALANFKGEVQVIPAKAKKSMQDTLTLDDLDLDL